MQVTVQMTFRRNGELFGKPRITFEIVRRVRRRAAGLPRCGGGDAQALRVPAVHRCARERSGWPSVYHAIGRRSKTQTSRERPMTDDNTLTLETTKGKVVIAMRPDLAPGHVARIKELVREGFYDGIVFHRVIDGFMAQTGCPHGTGTGGSGKKLKAEFNSEPHVRGTVSMARAQNPGFRRQPVLHLLRRRRVPQRPVHGLGPGDRRHGERRQDQARRAGAESRQDRVGEDGGPIGRRPRSPSYEMQTVARSGRMGRLRTIRRGSASHTQASARTTRARSGRAGKHPCKEHRRRAEAPAIGNHAGRNVASGVRAFDHHRAHGTLPIRALSLACCYSVVVRRSFDANAAISRHMPRLLRLVLR